MEDLMDAGVWENSAGVCVHVIRTGRDPERRVKSNPVSPFPVLWRCQQGTSLK